MLHIFKLARSSLLANDFVQLSLRKCLYEILTREILTRVEGKVARPWEGRMVSSGFSGGFLYGVFASRSSYFFLELIGVS